MRAATKSDIDTFSASSRLEAADEAASAAKLRELPSHETPMKLPPAKTPACSWSLHEPEASASRLGPLWALKYLPPQTRH